MSISKNNNNNYMYFSKCFFIILCQIGSEYIFI